jgi:hypothetical protein
MSCKEKPPPRPAWTAVEAVEHVWNMEVLGLFMDLIHVNALNILIDDHV